MTQKQKLFAGIAVAVLVLGALIWSQSSPSKTKTKNTLSSGSNTQVDKVQKKPVETNTENLSPDDAVDSIVNDAAIDNEALNDEITAEQDAVTASGSEINNLTQPYDETKL